MFFRKFATALCCASTLTFFPVAAQEAAPVETASDPDALVCFRGAWRDVPQVAVENRGRSFHFLGRVADIPAMTAFGFAEVECGAAALANPRAREAWRDRICAMAAYGNAAVQRQYEQALGVAPAILCGSAERVAGPWQRERARQPDDGDAQ